MSAIVFLIEYAHIFKFVTRAACSGMAYTCLCAHLCALFFRGGWQFSFLITCKETNFTYQEDMKTIAVFLKLSKVVFGWSGIQLLSITDNIPSISSTVCVHFRRFWLTLTIISCVYFNFSRNLSQLVETDPLKPIRAVIDAKTISFLSRLSHLFKLLRDQVLETKLIFRIQNQLALTKSPYFRSLASIFDNWDPCD